MTPWPEILACLPPMGERMMHDNESYALYRLAEVSRPGLFLEIGAYHGWSTGCLAAGMPPDSVLVSVDPHEGLGYVDAARAEPSIQACWETLGHLGVRSRVCLLPASTRDARESLATLRMSRPWQMVFIDGSHETEDVLVDLSQAEHVAPGGYLMMDDLGFESVQRAIDLWSPGVHGFVPLDLRVLGIEDPVHQRTPAGFVEKSRVWRRSFRLR